MLSNRPEKAVLLLCDFQENSMDSILYSNEIVETSCRLLKVCKLLNVPYVVTEHSPTEKYGKIVKKLRDKIDQSCVFGKTLFSMCTPSILKHLAEISPNYEHLILCGVEAHVCVLSTCLDFLESGKFVHVIADGISSRSLIDRKYSLLRMKQSGALLTTSESIMLQLCKDSNNPKYDEIEKITFLVKPFSDSDDI